MRIYLLDRLALILGVSIKIGEISYGAPCREVTDSAFQSRHSSP